MTSKAQARPNNLQSQLAVIEGKWGEATNLSVRGFFDILSDINFSTPHAYYYEMFVESESFKSIIGRIGKMKDINLLYIGAHGGELTIEGSGGEISRTVLKNALSELSKGSLEGIFFGTCLFTNEKNANYILNPNADATPIKWMAGYQKEVEWGISAAMDMLFWSKYFDQSNKKSKNRIETVAEELKKLVPGLIEELGMEIYVRNTGRNGGVKNLLA